MNSCLSGFSIESRPLTCRRPEDIACLPIPGESLMFAFDRSAFAVLVPLALLLAVVLWSRQADSLAAPQQAQEHSSDRDQTVAANLPSR
jgi:hypothetical protein